MDLRRRIRGARCAIWRVANPFVRWFAVISCGIAPHLLDLPTAKSAPAFVQPLRLGPGATGWADAGLKPIRGITIGPIENRLHPSVGYGSVTCGRAMDVAKEMGATWVALTPFGRMWSTRTSDIDLRFELPFEDNRIAVGRAIDQAHARGLSVMLVPHLWMEQGGWRGEIEPFAVPDVKTTTIHVRGRASEAAFQSFSQSYRRFVLAWADVAEAHHVELFSAGVELRSWVTSARATDELRAIIRDIRVHYRGLLTYSGNWDDIDDTVVLREVDVLGVNAFFPLAEREGASLSELLSGGARLAAKVLQLADSWQKPVVFTEIGYTTRPNPAVRPWEWPDDMRHVVVDEVAQAEAFFAALSSVIGVRSFAGFFVWRQFSDPDDVSQEAAWGFPVHGKLAELVVRDAFASRWASDTFEPPWAMFGRGSRGVPGMLQPYPKLMLNAP